MNSYAATGGAARAVVRLHSELRRIGVDASLLTNSKYFGRLSVHNTKPPWFTWLAGCMDIFPCKAYPDRQLHNFSPAWVPDGSGKRFASTNPDLVHLHWVGDGFLRVESIGLFGVPIVWTLHDSWPFTGGCYLPGKCTRYQQSCGCCPVLGSKKVNDLSRRVWQRKRHVYPVERMVFVAPSQWMAARARASSLLQGCVVEVIANGVDVARYSPGDKQAARRALGLPADGKIILFGAKNIFSDPNKGSDLAWETLGRLPAEKRRAAKLVLFGEKPSSGLPAIDMEIYDRGVIADESSMVDIYRAADLFLVTSRQENLPNTILEAMACGLPCAAFAVGGIPEQIAHRQTGCLATPYDAGVLAGEVAWMLEAGDRQVALAGRAREDIVNRFALELVASQYLALYLRLVGRKNPVRHQEVLKAWPG